jgi:hypothetical protein
MSDFVPYYLYLYKTIFNHINLYVFVENTNIRDKN